jgi:hypothetical protein
MPEIVVVLVVFRLLVVVASRSHGRLLHVLLVLAVAVQMIHLSRGTP